MIEMKDGEKLVRVQGKPKVWKLSILKMKLYMLNDEDVFHFKDERH